jgi:hypothetical protein
MVFSLLILDFSVSSLIFIYVLAEISFCLSFNLASRSIFFSFALISSPLSSLSIEIAFFFKLRFSSSILITYDFSSSCLRSYSYYFYRSAYSASFSVIDSLILESLSILWFSLFRFLTISIYLFRWRLVSF